MSEIPPCPRFAKGHGCERSDPVVVDERDAKGTSCTFYCRTCGCGYAITRPEGKAAAALDRYVSNLRRQQEAVRRREQKPRYFV